MGMTPNEAELNDVESHYPTDRIPMEMKEKSVAENLLDKMSETQWVFVSVRVLDRGCIIIYYNISKWKELFFSVHGSWGNWNWISAQTSLGDWKM